MKVKACKLKRLVRKSALKLGVRWKGEVVSGERSDGEECVV